ncbi:4-hydroxy-tetrahydrodipicolinate synthase [Thermanaerosceptrum fracticalcis]|uniref:4-hydroxy-tetrahydrodipicolinate synthase n=1 Tax=Thermanaerosceptrum fracticalcis TaxID=1712410 RepID=A0A7G6E412_THEFR|nr:4-hydroxy-tetrahydrodipicolinate synthase [Thermanaerosceptrum fracticalcis]QNB46816.1 4-hydroxy-tetrahydrodipicolinate synthase [Thermanaerosceptrum fracticalcis]
MSKFPRMITAMVTPFKDDLSVDYEGAQKLALYLIESGNDGLVIAGTTGESPTLSLKEKLSLFTAVKEAVGNKGQIIAGTGSNSTADSIYLTQEAEKIGVDGIMAVVPYYNKPNQEGMYQHFKAIATETSLPVMLYNVPGRTGTNLLPETVARLAGIGNIVALKEAAGNLDQVSTLKTLLPEDFLIFSGDDSLTLPMLSVGAYGVVSVAGHLIGNSLKKMIDSYMSGDVHQARVIHQQLFPLFRAIFVTTNPIPVKKALSLLGLPSGKLRLPLVEASAKETETITEALTKLNLI